ncbi:hypothetical protein A8C32_17195 [Flavivirga aquatica]|uniref:Uncharacterized protein n=1 Tax=Flavivirga aquatica TaxID=1849968 RepID=A0A1E5T830_9FLAO|nr:hypothetical protein [Flavivirga aquatica]OEK07532.1 hypothetical protein A8C32_17195 [Flavivirga aquatica]
MKNEKSISFYASQQEVSNAEFGTALTAGACSTCSSSCGVSMEEKTINHYSSNQEIEDEFGTALTAGACSSTCSSCGTSMV